jgi:hypothetical protein
LPNEDHPTSPDQIIDLMLAGGDGTAFQSSRGAGHDEPIPPPVCTGRLSCGLLQSRDELANIGLNRQIGEGNSQELRCMIHGTHVVSPAVIDVWSSHVQSSRQESESRKNG